MNTTAPLSSIADSFPPLSTHAGSERIVLEGAGEGNTRVVDPGPGLFTIDATGMDSGTLEIRQDSIAPDPEIYVRIDGKTDTGEILRFGGQGILTLEGMTALMERDALAVAGTGLRSYNSRDVKNTFELTPPDTGSITVRLATESGFVLGESDGLVVIDARELGNFAMFSWLFDGLGNVDIEVLGRNGFFGSDFGETYVGFSTSTSYSPFDGNGGIDTLSFAYDHFLSGVHVNFGEAVNQPPFATGTLEGYNGNATSFRWEIESFENAIGTAYADRLHGDAGANTLEGRDGDDTIYGDGFEAAHAPLQAKLVYAAFLGGTGTVPTGIELRDLTRDLLEGKSPLDTLQSITDSLAFKLRYDALPAEMFLEQIYRDLLGREVDEAARDHWLTMTENPQFTELLLRTVAFGREYLNGVEAEATVFAHQATPAAWSDEVFRLYRATLDRDPDLDGSQPYPLSSIPDFQSWTESLADDTTLRQAAADFTARPEFVDTYGSLDDAGFVDMLYRNVLDRAPNAAGLQNWVDVLAGGADRSDVVLGFSQSREFRLATEAPLESWMRAQGTHDRMEGGAGDDMLAGGILSDAFVFSSADPGSDTVVDLEAWDTLVFSDFGYESEAEVRSHMSQQGGHVVFADQGVSVTLLHTSLGAISDEMILI